MVALTTYVQKRAARNQGLSNLESFNPLLRKVLSFHRRLRMHSLMMHQGLDGA